MSHTEKLTIDLHGDLAADLRSAIADGDYDSIGDAVEDALRGWQRRRAGQTETLREMVRAGIDSGPGVDAGPVFARLRATYDRSAAE